MIFEGLGGSASYIRGGTVRALAVTSPKRSPAFPELPTMAEAGVPGFESTSWYGLFAPAGTPPGNPAPDAHRSEQGARHRGFEDDLVQARRHAGWGVRRPVCPVHQGRNREDGSSVARQARVTME